MDKQRTESAALAARHGQGISSCSISSNRTAQPANSPTNSKANIVDTSPCLLPTLLSLYQLIIDSGATDHITPLFYSTCQESQKYCFAISHYTE